MVLSVGCWVAYDGLVATKARPGTNDRHAVRVATGAKCEYLCGSTATYPSRTVWIMIGAASGGSGGLRLTATAGPFWPNGGWRWEAQAS